MISFPFSSARVLALVAVAFFLAAGAWKCYRLGQQDVQQRWDAERAELAEQYKQVLKQARDTEDKLRADAAKQRKDDASKLAKTRASYQRTIAGLQERASRPNDERVSENRSSGTPGSGAGNSESKGCTGQELYRQDAEFLAREASRAELYQIRYESCYQRYTKIKTTLDELAEQSNKN